MAETAKARMEGISDKASTFTRATHVEHVKGMFKVRNKFVEPWKLFQPWKLFHRQVRKRKNYTCSII